MGRAAYRREIWWAILFVGLVVGMWVGSEGGFSFLRGMGGGVGFVNGESLCM
jgi:hypothetical protein